MDAAFLDQIKQSLAASLSPDGNLRKQAEEFIETAKLRPDYCSALLETSSDKQIDPNVALSASVLLGQCVEYHWKYKTVEQAEKISVTGFKFIILNEADKEYVRTNIVSKMFDQESNPIKKQYVRSIITICRFDYPEKWPTLLNDISNALQSGNEKGILTGCVTLFCLAKKYEYELDEERAPILNIMEQVSPTLGSIIETYMAQLDNENALAILH